MRPILTALLAASFLPLAATTASQARPSTKSYTCEGAKNFVQNNGAVVMNHKRSDLYRRFVSRRGFCDRGDTTRRFKVPTKSGKCFLLICAPKTRFYD